MLLDFLYQYGYLLAIGVAIILVIVVVIILIRNRNKRQTTPQTVSFDLGSLGGKENIISASLKGSRLYVELKDVKKVIDENLKNQGVTSIIKSETKVIIISPIGEIILQSINS